MSPKRRDGLKLKEVETLILFSGVNDFEDVVIIYVTLTSELENSLCLFRNIIFIQMLTTYLMCPLEKVVDGVIMISWPDRLRGLLMASVHM